MRDPLACTGQHRLRDVDADDLAALAHGLRQRHGGRTGAAADLEHPLAGRYRRSRQQQIVDGAHAPLDGAGEADPARAGNRVPILLLGGICDVAFRHIWLLSVQAPSHPLPRTRGRVRVGACSNEKER